MSTKIGVSVLEDDQDISVSNSQFFHMDCPESEKEPLKLSRDPAAKVYKLACNCGLSIAFAQLGLAEQEIQLVAICGVGAVLSSNSCISNQEGRIEVWPFK